MKTSLIADIQTIPSSLGLMKSTAKIVLVLAAAISILSVVFSLSVDSKKKSAAFFFGQKEAVMARWMRGVDWDDVHKAYPYTSNQTESEPINNEEYGE